MSSPLLASRAEGWRYDLVDAGTLQVVHPLSGIRAGGQLDFDTTATIRGSGSIVAVARELGEVDWLAHLIRVTYYNAAGIEYPLITGMLSTPGQDNGPAVDVVNVALYDRTQALEADRYGETFTVPVGANPLAVAAGVVGTIGGLQLVADAYAGTLPEPMVWDANATKLAIVNGLLKAANFAPVYATPDGRLRFASYQLPATRPIAWDFAAGPDGLYLPTWRYSQKLADVPNRMIVLGQTSGATEALRSVAEDWTSPRFGRDARGRWITPPVVSDVAFDGTQAGLDAIARRLLAEAQQVAASVTITHPVLPIGVTDAATFTNRRLGTNRVTCERQTYRLAVGATVESVLRIVL